MQRPAVVVVESLVVAVAVPPLAPVPAVDPLQRAVDGRLRAFRLDTRVEEETADRQAEQPPVVVDGRRVEGGQQPVHGPGADLVVQGVPQPGPGQPQAEGDGGGFDDGLPGVRDDRPGVGVLAVQARLGHRVLGARGEPFAVPGQVTVRVLAAAAGHPEGGREEGTGVPFESVRTRPGPTGAGAREIDETVAGRRERDDRLQEAVGRGFPVRTGPAGVRTALAVLRRQGAGHPAGGLSGLRGLGHGHGRFPYGRRPQKSSTRHDRTSRPPDRLTVYWAVRSRWTRVRPHSWRRAGTGRGPGPSPSTTPRGGCRRARACCATS